MKNSKFGYTVFNILIFLTLFSLYAIKVFDTAWCGDDIYITLRSVLNFTHGYGMVYNVGERVQAFTHPLWFFMLSGAYLLTRNYPKVLYILPIIISFLTFILLNVYYRKNIISCIACSLILIFSNVFIDYSTSGLENPLSHLLLLLLIIVGEKINDNSKNNIKIKKSTLTLFYLIVSCVFLNRQDLILLILPYVLYVSFDFGLRIRCCDKLISRFMFFVKLKSSLKNFIFACLLGFLPAIAWEAFSIYYYGFPFPNTYYAKLYTQIPFDKYLMQGWRYVEATFDYDRFTIYVLILLVIIRTAKKGFNFAINVGVIAYCCYIINVGGDFMVGRFFSPVIFYASLKLSQFQPLPDFNTKRIIIKNFTFLTIVLSLMVNAKIYNSTMYFKNDGDFWYGIANERVYYKDRHLSNIEFPKEDIEWNIPKIDGVVEGGGGVGMAGVHSPTVYILDVIGLSNALIARLPKGNRDMRIGHVERLIPKGLIESEKEGNNQIRNEEIRDYYERLKIVTSGTLNSLERFKSIFYLNFVKKKLPQEIIYKEDY